MTDVDVFLRWGLPTIASDRMLPAPFVVSKSTSSVTVFIGVEVD